MLRIRGTNFIGGWAYAKWISLHAEHTRNRFHRMLSMRGNVWKSNISAESNTIFKISCYRPLGPYGFGFCKKVLKKSCLCTFKQPPPPPFSVLHTGNGRVFFGMQSTIKKELPNNVFPLGISFFLFSPSPLAPEQYPKSNWRLLSKYIPVLMKAVSIRRMKRRRERRRTYHRQTACAGIL